ncbi:ZmpA/ZmpB/ZmpC family metallo-endopeptidase [Streptococcus oriscaviae]
MVEEGQTGIRTIETKETYADGQLIKSEEVSNAITTAPVPQIVHIGTKPVTEVPSTAPGHEVPAITIKEETVSRTEVLAFETQEVYDNSLAEGVRQVVQEGKTGIRTIETKETYADGQLIKSEEVSNAITTAPVPQIVHIGVKKSDVLTTETEQRTELIQPETVYTSDAALYTDEEMVLHPGSAGEKLITTTYQLLNGVRLPQPTVTETITKEVVNRHIARGTKPIQGTESQTHQEEVSYPTEYVLSDQLFENEEQVIQPGVNGSKEITTTYVTIKGVRQPHPTVTEKVVKEPTKKIVARGTKKKIEEVPTVVITQLTKDLDAKSVTVSYQLTNPSNNFRQAIALLYDGEQLVQEVSINDANGSLTLTGLDYYKNYTLKTRVHFTMAEEAKESIQESIRQFELEYKKIEIKDIDAAVLYRRKNGVYLAQNYLSDLPENLEDVFVKVTSDRFKDLYLPVTSMVPETIEGQDYFKITSSFDELVQDNGQRYKANHDFYVPKVIPEAGTYLSFTELINAIRANPSGTFKLGADLDASELAVGDVAAYITETFQGTLIGENNGRKYAIHNLKAPLFKRISGATIQQLDLKNGQITTNNIEIGALASFAVNARVEDVSVQSTISGRRLMGGLFYHLDQSTVSNVSFRGSIKTNGPAESQLGGIAAKSTGSYIDRAYVDATISALGSANHTVGGIAGLLTGARNATRTNVTNSVVTGEIINQGSSQMFGGIFGNNQGGWTLGRVDNVISTAKLTNANPIYGVAGQANTTVLNAYANLVDSDNPQITLLTQEELSTKEASFGITTNLEDSTPLKNNSYSVDYLKVDGAKPELVTAYYNMEKLLPFYNKELLVRYANKLAVTDKLNRVRLLDVVPMKDGSILANLYAEKANLNKLMLHYEDGSVDYKQVQFKEDFANQHVVEYRILDSELIYTPETFLSSRSTLITSLSTLLQSVDMQSDAVKSVLGISATDASQTVDNLYLQPTFAHVQSNIATYLGKLFASSLNGQGQAAENHFYQTIADNKEAFLLGLSYLDRWYNIQYGDLNTKDLTIFEPDFFGNESKSAFETIITLGKSGYASLRPRNNVTTYATNLAQQTGKASLFDFVETYRERFLPDKTNNQWFKETSKAYIVESKSQVEAALAKQNAATKHSVYAVEVYDKITNPSWRFRQMLLPLLTLPEETIYIISNMNTISFGSFERYKDIVNKPETKSEVRAMVDQAAIWQRDHVDFWYKILDETNREKLFASVMNTDSFKLIDKTGQVAYRTLQSDIASIQNFFGPVDKWYRDNGLTAYANGTETHFVNAGMLYQDGTSLYTHEMVHNQDGNIYFQGNGRRPGQGAELFALGLLQNVYNLSEPVFGINTYLTGAESATRVHPIDPVNRYTNVEDLNTYARHMMDAIYLLDYLEGTAILSKSDAMKKQWLRKIENYYMVTDGKNNHAGNQIRLLTDQEVSQLQNFMDLVDHSIITRRNYSNEATLNRNGYYQARLFAPIYSALDNPYGAPGDMMFRRMAFELLAEKGFVDGFIPYVSNQLGEAAKASGSTIYDNWSKKTIGLITDQHVFDHIFKGEYTSWTDFKKKMYQERIDKTDKLKPFTIQYEIGKPNSTKEVVISTYADMVRLMKEAMDSDASEDRIFYSTNYVANSRVNALKHKLYSAMLQSTDDFKQSIFHP